MNMGLPPKMTDRFEFVFGLPARTAFGKSIAAAAIMTLHHLRRHLNDLKYSPQEMSKMLSLQESLSLLDENAMYDAGDMFFYLKEVGTSYGDMKAAVPEWQESSVVAIRRQPPFLQSFIENETKGSRKARSEAPNLALKLEEKFQANRKRLMRTKTDDDKSQKGAETSDYPTQSLKQQMHDGVGKETQGEATEAAQKHNTEEEAARVNASKTMPEELKMLWTKEETDNFFQKADRIAQTKNPNAAKKLWHTTKDALGQEKPADTELPDTIFARLLKMFFEVKLKDMAVDVWNHMISLHYEPTPKHWTAMLAGCSKARDAESLQGVWLKMRAAKVEPDNETWTAYIHGTFRAKEFRRGMELLAEIRRDWK